MCITFTSSLDLNLTCLYITYITWYLLRNSAKAWKTRQIFSHNHSQTLLKEFFQPEIDQVSPMHCQFSVLSSFAHCQHDSWIVKSKLRRKLQKIMWPPLEIRLVGNWNKQFLRKSMYQVPNKFYWSVDGIKIADYRSTIFGG